MMSRQQSVNTKKVNRAEDFHLDRTVIKLQIFSCSKEKRSIPNHVKKQLSIHQTTRYCVFFFFFTKY